MIGFAGSDPAAAEAAGVPAVAEAAGELTLQSFNPAEWVAVFEACVVRERYLSQQLRTAVRLRGVRATELIGLRSAMEIMRRSCPAMLRSVYLPATPTDQIPLPGTGEADA